MDGNAESNMDHLCRFGCGFYGNPATEGLCSVCYKEYLRIKQLEEGLNTSNNMTSPHGKFSGSKQTTYEMNEKQDERSKKASTMSIFQQPEQQADINIQNCDSFDIMNPSSPISNGSLVTFPINIDSSGSLGHSNTGDAFVRKESEIFQNQGNSEALEVNFNQDLRSETISAQTIGPISSSESMVSLASSEFEYNEPCKKKLESAMDEASPAKKILRLDPYACSLDKSATNMEPNLDPASSTSTFIHASFNNLRDLERASEPVFGPSTTRKKDGLLKKSKRCAVCRKKLGLTGVQCRCGGYYCGMHRYSDRHNCTYDYRQAGADEVRRNNPIVVAEKIKKL